MAAFSFYPEPIVIMRPGTNTGDGQWVYYSPNQGTTTYAPWEPSSDAFADEQTEVDQRAARLAQLLAWTRAAIAEHQARSRTERPGRKRMPTRTIQRRARVCSTADRYRVRP